MNPPEILCVKHNNYMAKNNKNTQNITFNTSTKEADINVFKAFAKNNKDMYGLDTLLIEYADTYGGISLIQDLIPALNASIKTAEKSEKSALEAIVAHAYMEYIISTCLKKGATFVRAKVETYLGKDTPNTKTINNYIFAARAKVMLRNVNVAKIASEVPMSELIAIQTIIKKKVATCKEVVEVLEDSRKEGNLTLSSFTFKLVELLVQREKKQLTVEACLEFDKVIKLIKESAKQKPATRGRYSACIIYKAYSLFKKYSPVQGLRYFVTKMQTSPGFPMLLTAFFLAHKTELKLNDVAFFKKYFYSIPVVNVSCYRNAKITAEVLLSIKSKALYEDLINLPYGRLSWTAYIYRMFDMPEAQLAAIMPQVKNTSGYKQGVFFKSITPQNVSKRKSPLDIENDYMAQMRFADISAENREKCADLRHTINTLQEYKNGLKGGTPEEHAFEVVIKKLQEIEAAYGRVIFSKDPKAAVNKVIDSLIKKFTGR